MTGRRPGLQVWLWSVVAGLFAFLTIGGAVIGEFSWRDLLLTCLAVFAAVATWSRQGREARRSDPPQELLDDVRPEVLAVAAGGTGRDEVRAIRLLRERTGLGLVEARETVRRWLQEEGRTDER